MEIAHFVQYLDHLNTNVVRNSYPAPWDEDDVTYSWMKAWGREVRDVELWDSNGVLRVDCEGFKFRGKPENRYGDVAILVQIAFADGSQVRGVGYLEAKKRDRRGTAFSQLDLVQARRILGNAPKAQLLLYDYARITGFRPVQEAMWHVGSPVGALLTGFTHMLSLPLELYESTEISGAGLYKFGVPFARQFAYRYLYGLDLHFDPNSIAAVTGFRNVQDGYPNFVMSVRVAHGDSQLPEELRPISDLYEAI